MIFFLGGALCLVKCWWMGTACCGSLSLAICQRGLPQWCLLCGLNTVCNWEEVFMCTVCNNRWSVGIGANVLLKPLFVWSFLSWNIVSLAPHCWSLVMFLMKAMQFVSLAEEKRFIQSSYASYCSFLFPIYPGEHAHLICWMKLSVAYVISCISIYVFIFTHDKT